MTKIVLVEEDPESRAQLETNLRVHGYPVVAVAKWEDFRPSNGDTPRAAPLKLRDIERTAIEEALRVNHGNRTHAARQLGISLRKLQYRLKEYGQQPGTTTLPV